MTFDEIVSSRRSVRNYKNAGFSAEIAKAKIAEIVDFARKNAPSWKNSQTHRYYCALSSEKIGAVCNAMPERNQPKCENAIALICTAFVRDTAGFTNGVADNDGGNLWGAYDLGLSDSLILLKARDLGLDTLVMGLRDSDSLRKIFEIPENESIMSVISVGVRKENPNTPNRKEFDEIAKFF